MAFLSIGQNHYVNDVCDKSIDIVSDSVYYNDISFPQIDSFSCNGQASCLNGIWYRLQAGTKVFKIIFQTENNQIADYLIFRGSCTDLNCIEKHETNLYRFVDEDIYIFIYNKSDIFDKANFSLEIQQTEPSLYDDKNAPPLIACGESTDIILNKITGEKENINCAPQARMLWFKVSGNDGNITIYTAIDSLTFIPDLYYFPDSIHCTLLNLENGNFTFHSFNNKEYLFGIDVKNEVKGKLNLKIDCINQDTLFKPCEEALNLVCGDNTIIVPDEVKPDIDLSVSKEISSYFFIEGTGKFHKLKVDHPDTSEISYKILAVSKSEFDEACPSLHYISSFNKLNNFVIIPTSADSNYYIVIPKTLTEYRISNLCLPFNYYQNQFCENANELICNRVTSISGANNWFKLVGDGEVKKLEFQKSDFSGKLFLYKNDCNLKTLVFDTLFVPGKDFPVYIKTASQDTFLIHVNSFDNDYHTFEYVCNQSIDSNVYCSQSLPIIDSTIYTLDEKLEIYLESSRSLSCSEIQDASWFTLKGNGYVKKLIFYGQAHEVKIYKDQCNSCPIVSVKSDNINFLTEIDKDYFIEIIYEAADSFQVLNLEAVEGFSPLNPRPFTCIDSILNIDFKNLQNYIHVCNDHREGFTYWLKTKGENNLLELFSEDNDLNFVFYKNENDNLICNFSAKPHEKIFLEDSVEFLIGIYSNIQNSSSQLSVVCSENLKNFQCSDSDSLQCGKNFIDFALQLPTSNNLSYACYRKLTGNGDFIKFAGLNQNVLSYKIFDESCTQVLSSNQNYFETVEGLNYVVLFSSNVSNDTIYMVCLDSIPEFNCLDLKILNCNENYIYNSALSQTFNSIENAVAFSLQPSDDFYILRAVDTSLLFYLLSYDSNCDSLVRIASVIPNQPLNIKSEGRHIIVVKGSRHYYYEAEFQLTCIDANGTDCENAHSLKCNQDYKFEPNQLTSPFGKCDKDESGIWLKITGKEGLFTLKFNNVNDNTYLLKGSGNCSDLLCNSKIYLNPSNANYSFEAEDGIDYYFKLLTNQVEEIGLTLDCDALNENSNCGNAELIQCGQEVKTKYFSTPTSIDTICDENSGGLYYDFMGNGDLLQLKSSSPDSFDLFIFEGSCTENICIQKVENFVQNSMVSLKTELNKTYFFKFSGQNREILHFNVYCLSGPLNNDCLTSIPLKCDSLYLTNVNSYNITDQNKCSYNNRSKIWYSLSGNRAIYKFDNLLNKTNVRAKLITGSCNEYTCLDSFSLDEELLINIEDTLSYFIQFYSESNEINDTFLFKFSCLPYLNNDFCANAFSLNCGDIVDLHFDQTTYSPISTEACGLNAGKDAWYKIEGNGEVAEFVLNDTTNSISYLAIFETGNCAELNCIYNVPFSNFEQSSTFGFVTEHQKEYLVRFSGELNFNNSINFTFNCRAPQSIEICEKALYIVKDTTILTDSMKYAMDMLPLECREEGRRTVWYRMIPSTDFIFLQNNDKSLKLKLFEGDCQNLECLPENIILPFDSKLIDVVKGSVYYLAAVYNRNINLDSGNFKLEFQGILPNDKCISARSVSCNFNSTYYSQQLENDPVNLYCLNDTLNAAWYKLIGKDSIAEITINNIDATHSISFLNGCTTFCKFNHLFRKNSFKFFTRKNEPYLFMLNHLKSRNNLIKFDIQCSEAKHKNLNQSYAINLGCKKYSIEAASLAIDIDNCEETTPAPRLWYKFKGNGEKIKLIRKPDSNLSYKIFNANCYSLHTFSAKDTTEFLTTNNSDYFLVVRVSEKYTEAEIKFEIQYKCDVDVTDNAIRSKILIRPNPFSNYATLDLSEINDDIKHISIKNSNGQVVNQLKGNIIDPNDELLPGMYLLEVTGEKGTYITKFMKIK